MTWKVTNQKTKIIINNLEELEPYIALSLKLFKTRTLELNQLFDVTIQTEFKSANDLCKYIKVKFGLTGSGFRYTKEQLLSLGWKFEEIEEYLKNYKLIKSLAAQKVTLENKRLRSKFCKEYWLSKGFSEEESLDKIREFQQRNSSLISDETRKNNFNVRVENLIKKGNSVEGALELIKLQQSKNSPLTFIYWFTRGFSDEESVKQISILQKYRSSFRTYNPQECVLRVEYWIKKLNVNVPEAKIKLNDYLKTRNVFSLEYCLEKYGEIVGLKIFNDRQVRWLNSLNNKAKEEIEEINRKKSSKINYETLWRRELDCSGMLYLIKIDENFVKIGVTTKEFLYQRYSKVKLKKYNLIKEFVGMNINTCFMIEQVVKREFKSCSERLKDWESGWTEILSEEFNIVENKCLYYINNLDELEIEFQKIKDTK